MCEVVFGGKFADMPLVGNIAPKVARRLRRAEVSPQSMLTGKTFATNVFGGKGTDEPFPTVIQLTQEIDDRFAFNKKHLKMVDTACAMAFAAMMSPSGESPAERRRANLRELASMCSKRKPSQAFLDLYKRCYQQLQRAGEKSK